MHTTQQIDAASMAALFAAANPPPHEVESVKAIAHAVADILAADCSSFDRERFLAACELPA